MTDPSPEELSEPTSKISLGGNGKEKEDGAIPPPAPGLAAGEPDLSNMSMAQIRAFIQKKEA